MISFGTIYFCELGDDATVAAMSVLSARELRTETSHHRDESTAAVERLIPAGFNSASPERHAN
jgi:hypothetical protein